MPKLHEECGFSWTHPCPAYLSGECYDGDKPPLARQAKHAQKVAIASAKHHLLVGNTSEALHALELIVEAQDVILRDEE